jgi:7-carboxy-7-deazaguanine synthase (Cx14CxxC type)
MTYSVKEMFLTLQGEGVHMGRRAVFLRFAGCNLWTGRDADRASAICRFCDTDFVGTDGAGGGKFADAASLAAAAAQIWGAGARERFIVITGGEPMLQLDQPLIDALHAQGFRIAIESNGTLRVPRSVDWICISPKAGSYVVQRSGDELKLVWPQPGSDWRAMAGWDFTHFLIQPMDGCKNGSDNDANRRSAMAFVQANPQWRLSLQVHKILGIA